MLSGVCRLTFSTPWERNYNPGQNSWETNATAGENDAFSLPPGLVLSLWLQIFFNTINIAEGTGTAETGSFNNISKHL